MIRAWRLVTILLVGLSMGMAFCHLLQMGPRMQYDVWLWKYTKGMFIFFGPSLGIVVEAAATLLCGGLLIFIRGRGDAFRWTVLCTVCMVIAHSAWWLLIYPVNQETIGWTKLSIPSNWYIFRALWECTHAARAIFEIVGFALLIVSVLSETPKNGLSKILKRTKSFPVTNNSIEFFRVTAINPFLKLLSSTFQNLLQQRRLGPNSSRTRHCMSAYRPILPSLFFNIG